MSADRFLCTRISREEDGVAAVEFTLLVPLLLLLLWGIVEILLITDVVNDVRHYNHQAGDYLSRQTSLATSDLDEVYDWRGTVMQRVDVGVSDVSVRVASIGYQTDGSPVVLWSRARGPKTLPLDLSDAADLAEAGQSVIFVASEVVAPRAFSISDATSITSAHHAFFRPRETRAIALNGSLSDAPTPPEGYADADD